MKLLADKDVLPLVAALAFSGEDVQTEMLCDVDCGPLLRAYLAFTDGRLGVGLTAEDQFYNRYFWFQRFANAHQAKFGEDAGIAQQAFQILEQANCEFDWSQLEQLGLAARR